MSSVTERVHEKFARAGRANIAPEAFGDPEGIAAAMVAAIPAGHVFDEISGPFYDTSGLIEWLGVSRQALNQRVQKYALLACPLADGAGVVYPTWQFLDNGSTIASLGEVLRVLATGTDDRWMVALWMQAVSDDLDGLRPSGWLRMGRDPQRVLDLATDAAQRWQH